jgi:hypothetical protein
MLSNQLVTGYELGVLYLRVFGFTVCVPIVPPQMYKNGLSTKDEHILFP